MHYLGGVTDLYPQQYDDSFTAVKGIKIYCPAGFKCPPNIDKPVPCD